MVRGLLTLRKRSFTRLVYIAVLHLCLAVGFVRLPRELKGEGPGCRAPIPPAPRWASLPRGIAVTRGQA